MFGLERKGQTAMRLVWLKVDEEAGGGGGGVLLHPQVRGCLFSLPRQKICCLFNVSITFHFARDYGSRTGEGYRDLARMSCL